jgi:hypothetical protein
MSRVSEYTVLEKIQTRTGSIELWDNGIIFYKMKDHTTIELEDSKVQLDFLKSKFNGKNKIPVLVQSGRYTDISKEAREFSAQPESNIATLASAVIVQTLAHRIIINFLINLTRQQNMKMRMFMKKKEAIEWLLKIKKETYGI